MDEKKISAGRKFVIILAFLMYVILFIYISTYHTYIPPSYSTDETANYLFTDIYAKTGNLLYTDSLNTLGEKIIRPNGVLLVDEKFVSMKFIGFPLYYGSYATVIGTNFAVYFTTIFAVIGTLFVYVLGNHLYGKTNGIISSFLLLILPYYMYWSTRPFLENLFGSVIFLLGIAYFFKAMQRKKLKYYALTALFLATSLNIRPDIILFLISIIFIIIINFKKIDLKFFIISMFIGAIIILPILLLNHDLYGGYLNTGQSNVYSTIPGIVGSGASLQEHLNVLFINLTNLNNASPLFSLIIFIGLYTIYFDKKLNLQLNSTYIFFLLISLMIFSLFYLAGAYPWQGGGLREAYTRYILPLYLSAVPLLTKSLQSFRHTKIIGNKMFILLLFIFILVNVIYTFSILNNEWNRRDGYSEITNSILERTEPNSIIFLADFDVYIYPERKVATIRNIQNENKEKATANFLFNLSKQELPMYFFKQNWYGSRPEFFFDFDKFEYELKAENIFELILLEENRFGKLYKIQTKNNPKNVNYRSS